MRVLRFLLLFGGFGLLPLWASVVYVYAGSLGESSSDYWAAAPWLIILALPFCAITLAMAGITYAVYATTTGDSSRKLKRALGCFALLSALVLAIAGFLWNRHKVQEADLAAEKEAGKAFVEQSAAVTAVAPEGFRVGLSSSSLVDGLPREYTYYVYSPSDSDASVMAIVAVSRDAGAAEFQLRCVVAEDDFQNREAESDPCDAASRQSSTPQADAPAIDTKACEAGGGSVRKVCRRQFPACVTPFPDAGHVCSDNSQCQGKCILDGANASAPDGLVTGRCQEDDDPCGCKIEVVDGRVAGGACVD